jgi:hypothetical protein
MTSTPARRHPRPAHGIAHMVTRACRIARQGLFVRAAERSLSSATQCADQGISRRRRISTCATLHPTEQRSDR